jgi:hypothetical protein
MNIKLYEERYERVLLISISYFMKTFLLSLVFYFESAHTPKASILRFISYKTFYYSITNGKDFFLSLNIKENMIFCRIIAYIVFGR